MTILPRHPRANAPFSQALQHDGYVVLDGALATRRWNSADAISTIRCGRRVC